MTPLPGVIHRHFHRIRNNSARRTSIRTFGASMKAMGGDGGNGGTLGVRPRTYLPSETRRTTQVDRSRDDWTILQATGGKRPGGERSTHTHASYSQDSDYPSSNQNNKHDKTLWPSGLRRWSKVPVRKGVGSNPTGVTLLLSLFFRRGLRPRPFGPGK